jgi:peroxiredoxin
MVSLTTPPGQMGSTAPDFDLPGVDGRSHTLASARGPHGLLVMFICNHCPYVKAVIGKIVRDTDALRPLGIGSIAVMSNDPSEYAEDSFENMRAVAQRERFGFPYVLDTTQAVARAYGAVCTPDFFGFDGALKLAYRGRLDASGRAGSADAPRELFDAMRDVAQRRPAPVVQHASVGCSIKWKRA